MRRFQESDRLEIVNLGCIHVTEHTNNKPRRPRVFEIDVSFS